MPKKCNLIKNPASEVKLFCFCLICLFVNLFAENEWPFSPEERKSLPGCCQKDSKEYHSSAHPLEFTLLGLVKIIAVLLKQNFTSSLIG